MRVLLIKTSSMGDLIHTLPALTDAGEAIPEIRFDWVVEQSFAEIPAWHPLVERVIPVSLRRWRKDIFSRQTRVEWQQLRQELKARPYDLILDAQGLVKSAFLTLFAKGQRAGLDFSSAREAWASWLYQRRTKVNFYQHAIVRMRQLFAQTLQYPFPAAAPDFGISRAQFQAAATQENYLVFLHSTTWKTKLWPEPYWVQLADLAHQAGLSVKISGGNSEELKRAERIAKLSKNVDALPRLEIAETARLLANAKGVVAVDTGFGHLAAALNLPIVSIYGSTNPAYTGAVGASSLCLSADFPCSPCLSRTCTYKKESIVEPACYTTIPPERVWKSLQPLL